MRLINHSILLTALTAGAIACAGFTATAAPADHSTGPTVEHRFDYNSFSAQDHSRSTAPSLAVSSANAGDPSSVHRFNGASFGHSQSSERGAIPALRSTTPLRFDGRNLEAGVAKPYM